MNNILNKGIFSLSNSNASNKVSCHLIVVRRISQKTNIINKMKASFLDSILNQYATKKPSMAHTHNHQNIEASRTHVKYLKLKDNAIYAIIINVIFLFIVGGVKYKNYFCLLIFVSLSWISLKSYCTLETTFSFSFL